MEYDLLSRTRLLCSTFPKTGRLERGVLRVQLALLGVSLVASPLRVWCGSRDECFAFFAFLQPFSWLVLLVALLAPLALLCAPLSIGVRGGGGGGVGDGEHSESHVVVDDELAFERRVGPRLLSALASLVALYFLLSLAYAHLFSLFAQLNY